MRIEVKTNSFGNIFVNLVDGDMSIEKKNEIIYGVYKLINESYAELLKHLPITEGKD